MPTLPTILTRCHSVSPTLTPVEPLWSVEPRESLLLTAVVEPLVHTACWPVQLIAPWPPALPALCAHLHPSSGTEASWTMATRVTPTILQLLDSATSQPTPTLVSSPWLLPVHQTLLETPAPSLDGEELPPLALFQPLFSKELWPYWPTRPVPAPGHPLRLTTDTSASRLDPSAPAVVTAVAHSVAVPPWPEQPPGVRLSAIHLSHQSTLASASSGLGSMPTKRLKDNTGKDEHCSLNIMNLQWSHNNHNNYCSNYYYHKAEDIWTI